MVSMERTSSGLRAEAHTSACWWPRSIRLVLLALALAQAPRSAWAGEPPADEPPLLSVQRLREAGDLAGAASKASAIAHTAGAAVEAHIAYQDLMRDLGRDAPLAVEYRDRARSETATADDLYLFARLLRGAKAVAQYRAALRADPAHFRALCGLGNELIDAADLRGAEKAYSEARTARAESGLPWNGLARVAEAKGDRAAAETGYRKAIELSPKLIVARVNLAVLLVALGRSKDALAVLDAAAAAAPKDPLPLVARGVVAIKDGRDEDAVRAFEAALAVDGRSVATLAMLASTYLNLNKLDLAEKAVTRALEIAPNTASVQVSAASLRLAKGEVAQARTAAERAVALDDQNPTAQFVLARAMERGGDARKAEAAYKKAVKLEETNPVFVRALAQYLGRQDRWKDAVKSFERVVELSRCSPESLYDLGLAQVGAAEPKRAVETFEQLVAMQPDHLNGWLKLGILYRERVRDAKRALKALRTYQEKGGKDARVKTWIAELDKPGK